MSNKPHSQPYFLTTIEYQVAIAAIKLAILESTNRPKAQTVLYELLDTLIRQHDANAEAADKAGG
jgi:hypothetical protein